MNILKPKNDSRKFKYFVLNNNIKCILIQDLSLDKSYVVSSVNVGSLSNKEYYDGMAHLLEHMCFITSKKYKEKNYLAKKVTEYGGTTNAYTAELNTVFYLDIFNEKLEEILEIFVDFLINAELKKEYILSELDNVDAEHKKNINNDSWKLINLQRILADKNNSYNGFYTGNKSSLNKKDIYEKMMEFYNKYYNANYISICVASNKEINEIYKIVDKYFGSIPKVESHEENPNNLMKPFYTVNKGKSFKMKTIGDRKILRYIFEIPIEIMDSKIFFIFEDILNIYDKSSCKNYLKNLGYINDFYSNHFNLGIFYINAELTKLGEENINYVNSCIEQSVQKILNFSWKDIFEYYKNKYEFLFNNLNKIDTLDLCIDLIDNLVYFNPSEIYIGNFNLKSISNEEIQILKKYINFENCIRIYATKDFNYSDYKIDKNYKTMYIDFKFENKDVDCNYLKLLNFDYTYYLIKPKFIPKIYNKIPELIKNRIWYGGTSEFNEPLVYCNILFSKIKYFNSPRNYLLTRICQKIINNYLICELSKFYEFNFNVSLEMLSQLNLVELSFYMYNDTQKIDYFINKTTNLINNIVIDNNRLIQSYVSIIIDELENIKSINPWEYLDYIISYYYENFYDYNLLLKTIKEININEIKMYLKKFFNDTGNIIFIYGNLDKKKLPKFDNINLDNNISKFQTINIKNIDLIHPNPVEKSNCVQICYFIGKFNPLQNLHLIFIKLILNDLFFKDLRTTKKLGYLVQMYSSKINEEYFIYQKIQSEYKPEEIIQNIEEFNENIIEYLEKIDLKQWKETVISHLKIKDNNLNERFHKYYLEIIERTYLFDRNKILLNCIDKITIVSLINFVRKFILNNENKSKIIVRSKIN